MYTPPGCDNKHIFIPEEGRESGWIIYENGDIKQAENRGITRVADYAGDILTMKLTKSNKGRSIELSEKIWKLIEDIDEAAVTPIPISRDTLQQIKNLDTLSSHNAEELKELIEMPPHNLNKKQPSTPIQKIVDFYENYDVGSSIARYLICEQTMEKLIDEALSSMGDKEGHPEENKKLKN